MIYVKPHHEPWEPGLKSKTFSYSEVEHILIELINCLNNQELIQESGIKLDAEYDIKGPGIRVFTQKDRRVCQLFFDLEDT